MKQLKDLPRSSLQCFVISEKRLIMQMIFGLGPCQTSVNVAIGGIADRSLQPRSSSGSVLMIVHWPSHSWRR